jgi:Cdc6-like AAA superfamily ATPase
MDAKLSKLAAMQMDLFIRVCDKALQLRYSHGRKFQMAVKVMFLADDGIQPFLGEMAKLIDKERNLVQAQVFLSTREAVATAQKNLELSRRVENVVTDMQARDKDVDRENSIKQALGFPKEPTTPWRFRYREYLNLRLSNTGQWVFNEPAFASWETGQSDVNILAIEGGNGTGKSFLASTIIQHLMHKKSTTETEPRVSTAYYFFEGEARDAVKNANNMETAAKSIVWQLTQAERNYKKSVAKICQDSQEIDPSSISSELLFENSDLVDMNVVFYIVIDGLSGKMGEGMLRFLKRASAVKGQHVRVLLTVDSECFQHLTSVENVILNSIPISSKSRPDVERVIQSRMDSMLALSKKNRPDIQQLRAKICRDLYQATAGDYFRINMALDDISKRQYHSGVLDALSKAGDGRTAQIIREIEEINQNCSEPEISEINEIIVWIQCYRESLSERQMAAALNTAVGESSLLTLADKIKEKYPLFKITNKGEVAFRAPEVEESIPNKQLSSTQEPDTPETAVSPGEIAMVTHFLSTVCPQDTYKKLDFEGFLNSKKKDRKPQIYKHALHIQEARIAFTCLRLITGETETPSEDLLLYAKTKFLDHLSAVNLALVDIEYKKQFGPLLIKLFTNQTCIDIALHINEFPESLFKSQKIRQLWFKDDTTKLILRWLSDTAVTLDIDNEARDWVTGLLQSEDHRELLLPAAKCMAIHLVQEFHFLPFNWSAHNFIVAFLDKVSYLLIYDILTV